jgi:transposase
MRQQPRPSQEPAEKVVQDIRRATRKHYSAEEKIRIVLEGLRGEDSIAELCRREGIAQNLYYRWSKDFLEAPSLLCGLRPGTSVWALASEDATCSKSVISSRARRVIISRVRFAGAMVDRRGRVRRAMAGTASNGGDARRFRSRDDCAS